MIWQQPKCMNQIIPSRKCGEEDIIFARFGGTAAKTPKIRIIKKE